MPGNQGRPTPALNGQGVIKRINTRARRYKTVVKPTFPDFLYPICPILIKMIAIIMVSACSIPQKRLTESPITVFIPAVLIALKPTKLLTKYWYKPIKSVVWDAMNKTLLVLRASCFTNNL